MLARGSPAGGARIQVHATLTEPHTPSLDPAPKPTGCPRDQVEPLSRSSFTLLLPRTLHCSLKDLSSAALTGWVFTQVVTSAILFSPLCLPSLPHYLGLVVYVNLISSRTPSLDALLTALFTITSASFRLPGHSVLSPPQHLCYFIILLLYPVVCW